MGYMSSVTYTLGVIANNKAESARHYARTALHTLTKVIMHIHLERPTLPHPPTAHAHTRTWVITIESCDMILNNVNE